MFAETCNYRILFYSVSDDINQRKSVGVEFSDSNVVLDYMVPVFLNNRFKKVCILI